MHNNKYVDMRWTSTGYETMLWHIEHLQSSNSFIFEIRSTGMTVVGVTTRSVIGTILSIRKLYHFSGFPGDFFFALSPLTREHILQWEPPAACPSHDGNVLTTAATVSFLFSIFVILQNSIVAKLWVDTSSLILMPYYYNRWDECVQNFLCMFGHIVRIFGHEILADTTKLSKINNMLFFFFLVLLLLLLLMVVVVVVEHHHRPHQRSPPCLCYVPRIFLISTTHSFTPYPLNHPHI